MVNISKVKTMSLPTHADLGVLIGAKINNPAASFAISLASHFLLDIIPHDPLEDLVSAIYWKENP